MSSTKHHWSCSEPLSAVLSAGRLAALRSFGLTMSLVLVLFGGLFLWKDRLECLGFFIGAAFFLSPAILCPHVLDPVERGWMAFGAKLGGIMSALIVSLLFLLAIIPAGLLARLSGKDFLSLRWEKDKKSYWTNIPADSPGSRPYLPY